MNTNWSKILLFTLLGVALGHIGTYWCMRHCGHGGCGHGEMSCHGEMGGAACEHHGEGKAACCSHMTEGHGMHDDAEMHVIVKDLEKANFQGDTTITIEGGTVNVHRMGDSTTVKVEMRKEVEEVVERAH